MSPTGPDGWPSTGRGGWGVCCWAGGATGEAARAAAPRRLAFLRLSLRGDCGELAADDWGVLLLLVAPEPAGVSVGIPVAAAEAI